MAALRLALLLLAHAATISFSLELQFYKNSCPRAELIVKKTVNEYFQRDRSISAGLLRLHFHDCFVRGCDASVLLDSTDDNIAEKEAPPNLSLRGLDLIDEIKAELEKECSGVVSCADIIALATRDGVALAGGEEYAVPTGRRDGNVSTMSDVHLPTPSFSVQAAQAAFKSINLDLTDLTTLLGAHSIGFCHCGFLLGRLYNFRGTGLSDPRMDSGLLKSLKVSCPPEVITMQNITRDPKVFMNQESMSSSTFDGSIYRSVLKRKALLQLDQELAYTDLTSRLANQYAKDPKFFIKQFSKSMIKLGNVGVLTGKDGEVRLNCRRVNNATIIDSKKLP
ncbi:peroxidase 57-like [Canna indica]|uniref:Peroxidase n=1 Tax=Canna indica TaxID=4628 RepID=A0AAQ3KTY1_9LILI|nr:peroxidase 57-like [Canna indica]